MLVSKCSTFDFSEQKPPAGDPDVFRYRTYRNPCLCYCRQNEMHHAESSNQVPRDRLCVKGNWPTTHNQMLPIHFVVLPFVSIPFVAIHFVPIPHVVPPRRGSIIGRTDESSEKSHNFNEIKQYLMNTLYLYFSGIINLLILHTTNIYFFFEEKVLLKSFVCNIILLLKLGKKLFFV